MTTNNKILIVVAIIIIAVMLVAIKNRNQKISNKEAEVRGTSAAQDQNADDDIKLNEAALASNINTTIEDVQISGYDITANDNGTIAFEFDVANQNRDTRIVSTYIKYFNGKGEEVGGSEYPQVVMEGNDSIHYNEVCMIVGEEISSAKVEVKTEEYKDPAKNAPAGEAAPAEGAEAAPADDLTALDQVAQ